MQIFLKFMGWLILYSFLYFLVLDFSGHGPDMKDAHDFIRTLNFYLMPLITLPLWWFSWKKFEKTFGPREPQSTHDGVTCTFALRNPALMYYLMVLKLFLLAMGANGIITLANHQGGARIFYIINFIVLYIYAIPFFIIKFIKLKKSLQTTVAADPNRINLAIRQTPVISIAYDEAQALLLETDPLALCVTGSNGAVCLGSKKSRISSFYVPGLERIVEIVRGKAGSKVEQVTGLKAALKARGIKPML